MLNRVLGPLFWDRQLSVSTRRLWFAALLSFPLALAAGSYLQFLMMERLAIRLSFGEEQLIEKARLYVASQSIDIQGWGSSLRMASDRVPLLEYLLDQGEAGRKAIAALGIPNRYQVIFTMEKRVVVVPITSTGIPLGYRLEPEKEWAIPAAALSSEQADQLAAKLVAALRQTVPFVSVSLEKVNAPPYPQHFLNAPQGGIHTYPYQVSLPNLPGVDGLLSIRIAGGRTVTNILSFPLAGTAKSPPTSGLKKAYEVSYWVFFAAVALFAIVRYFQRSRQKEVSHLRMLLVTAVFATLSAYTVLKMVPPETGAIGIPAFVAIMLVLALIFGALVGLAYAATEGDIREFLPSSLTSVDALLSGRLLTRNVARSFLLGACLLSWSLLLRNLIYWWAHPARMGLDALENLTQFALSRYTSLMMLPDSASSGIVICLLGFLLPATVLQRFIRNRRLQWTLVFALSLLILSKLMIAEPLPFLPAFAVTLLKAAALMFACYSVDVLAGIVFSAGFSYLISFAALSSTSQGQAPYLWVAALIPALLLAAAVLLSYRGRVVADAGVRPKYARDIEERQQLQSEIHAAREAQMRLLPLQLPRLPGATVAARCQPAELVAGDFFDFFPLSPTRLGILVTDGGSRGLDTALVIALVKGYLKHRCHAAITPRELLASLSSALGEHLAQANLHGLCYGVLDTAAASFEFARFGESPAFMVSDLDAPVQMELTVAGARPCWVGSAKLPPGSILALYTNGVCHLLGEPDYQATNRWMRKQLKVLEGQTVESLHQGIWNKMFSRPLGLGQRAQQDDVTVVMVQTNFANAQSAAEVA